MCYLLWEYVNYGSFHQLLQLSHFLLYETKWFVPLNRPWNEMACCWPLSNWEQFCKVHYLHFAPSISVFEVIFFLLLVDFKQFIPGQLRIPINRRGKLFNLAEYICKPSSFVNQARQRGTWRDGNSLQNFSLGSCSKFPHVISGPRYIPLKVWA